MLELVPQWQFHSWNTFRLVLFFHIIGIVVLGGRMLAMFVEDIRARTSKDSPTLLESLRHRWMLGMAGGPFGSVLVLVTGILLVEVRNYSWATGWIVTNLSIASFELAEGMLFTRWHLKRMAALAVKAKTDGEAVVRLRTLMNSPVPTGLFMIKPATFITMAVMSIFRPF